MAKTFSLVLARPYGWSMEFAWQHSGGTFFVAHLWVRHFLLVMDSQRYDMRLPEAVLLKAYPFNLLTAINGAVSRFDVPMIDLTHLPRDIHQSVAYVLYVLTYREECAIQLRYREEFTLTEVSEQMRVEPDCARQLIRNALDKLAQPHNIRYLRDGLHACTEHDIKVATAEQVRKARAADAEFLLSVLELMKEALQQGDLMTNILSNLVDASVRHLSNTQPVVAQRTDDSLLDRLNSAQERQATSQQESRTPLASLGLTARTYNCLTNAGIRTIEDLHIHQPSELMRIRGFGKRSYQDVVEHLAAIGIDTSMY